MTAFPIPSICSIRQETLDPSHASQKLVLNNLPIINILYWWNILFGHTVNLTQFQLTVSMVYEDPYYDEVIQYYAYTSNGECPTENAQITDSRKRFSKVSENCMVKCSTTWLKHSQWQNISVGLS